MILFCWALLLPGCDNDEFYSWWKMIVVAVCSFFLDFWEDGLMFCEPVTAESFCVSSTMFENHVSLNLLTDQRNSFKRDRVLTIYKFANPRVQKENCIFLIKHRVWNSRLPQLNAGRVWSHVSNKHKHQYIVSVFLWKDKWYS